MAVFDMPGPSAGFQARAGWLVRRLMVDLNLTMEQAAGFVGNLGYESGEFKSLQELKPQVSGSRGGYGWAQWTASRRRQFEGWCADHGMKPSSDEANYGFLVAELQGSGWESFLARLRKSRGLEEAAQVTEAFYERPQEAIDGTFASLPIRIAKGRVALAGAKAATDPTEPPPADTPTVPDKAADDRAQAISAVKAIQAVLQLYGSYEGKVDGDWGKQSEDALCALLESLDVECVS